MRVATANSYDNTISTLSKRQSDLAALQERLSTGKRVLKASDDPVAAVLSEAASHRLSRVENDKRALDRSVTSLKQGESALGEAGELVQQVRELLVSAGNGTYGPAELRDIAQQIEGLRERMIGVANQRDTNGRTLFGGLGGSSVPFVEVYGATGSAVRFDGQRGQEATGNNSLPQSFDGDAIWMRVPQGNGTFALAQGAGNTGSVRADTGTVNNPGAVTGDDYSIGFAEVAGVMAFSVTNTTTGLPVTGMSNVPYVQGSSVSFDGMVFAMDGQPQTGDTIELSAATTPTDLFKVMQNAIDALRSSDSAARIHTVGRSMSELDAGHDRILQARSQAGSWLNRGEATEQLLGNRAVAHATEKSQLEDLDMIKGLSDFQNQNTGLQVALQSYAQVQRLSLFQYIG